MYCSSVGPGLGSLTPVVTFVVNSVCRMGSWYWGLCMYHRPILIADNQFVNCQSIAWTRFSKTHWINYAFCLCPYFLLHIYSLICSRKKN
jgi:hypothetical protein